MVTAIDNRHVDSTLKSNRSERAYLTAHIQCSPNEQIFRERIQRLQQFSQKFLSAFALNCSASVGVPKLELDPSTLAVFTHDRALIKMNKRMSRQLSATGSSVA
jgi:hypothetical protein